jgi:hypothetical protein
MRKPDVIFSVAIIVMSGVLFSCDNGGTPTGTASDKLPGTVIMSEGFEGDLSNYKQVVYTEGQALMSLSKQFAHSGKGSLTSDSNNTSIKCLIEPSIDDSIAGLQFYLMATKKSHTNFLVALCKPGSSANGLFTTMGMGIDKSDSLNCYYQDTPDSTSITSKNSADMILNKWYKCNVEYDYSDTTITYSVDDAVVFKKPAPNPMTLKTFVVMRDDLGAQGTSGYYLDDIAIYKR